MGSFSDHGFVGLLTALVASWLLGFTTYQPFITCWLVYVFGNFFPDVDSRSSKIHRYLLWPRLFKWKHWGHAHSIIGDLLFSTPFIAIDLVMHFYLGFTWYLFVYFNAGCLVHCLVDDAMKGPFNVRKATKIW